MANTVWVLTADWEHEVIGVFTNRPAAVQAAKEYDEEATLEDYKFELFEVEGE